MSTDQRPDSDFARQADGKSAGFMSELFAFARTSKRWWLTPVIVLLLLVGIFIVLSTTVLSPFIYTLF